MERLARAIENYDPTDDGNAPIDTVSRMAYFDRKTAVIAAEYARLLPTQASDSPEKP